MDITIHPPNDTIAIKTRTITKPKSELEMIVRRYEDDDSFWIYLYAREELAARNKLEANNVGLMYQFEEDDKISDFIKNTPIATEPVEIVTWTVEKWGRDD